MNILWDQSEREWPSQEVCVDEPMKWLILSYTQCIIIVDTWLTLIPL